MAYIKDLIKQHGYGITIHSINRDVFPFKVLRKAEGVAHEVIVVDDMTNREYSVIDDLLDDYELCTGD